MEENNHPLDSDLTALGPVESLQVTPVVKHYWREISYWALFLAVLGFVSLGLMALLTFTGENQAGLVESLLGLMIVGGIIFLPYWYLFQFARQLKQGLDTESTGSVETSFAYLRRFYQFTGIFTIIFLSLYLIILVSVLSVRPGM